MYMALKTEMSKTCSIAGHRGSLTPPVLQPCSPQCTVLCSVEECLWRHHASDKEFRGRMAGFKADQHRVPQENSSASKGREAAEPPPGHSTLHAPIAPPVEQLHASGSSALTQSESLVSTHSRLKACGAQDQAHLLSKRHAAPPRSTTWDGVWMCICIEPCAKRQQ